jgi:hypothetical protein
VGLRTLLADDAGHWRLASLSVSSEGLGRDVVHDVDVVVVDDLGVLHHGVATREDTNWHAVGVVKVAVVATWKQQITLSVPALLHMQHCSSATASTVVELTTPILAGFISTFTKQPWQIYCTRSQQPRHAFIRGAVELTHLVLFT